MASATEASFTKLAGVPVRYDREPVSTYGSAGVAREWQCTNKLKDQLEDCITTLFYAWPRGKPDAILTAGTIGDGGMEHGKGLAFDLDGFFWAGSKIGHPWPDFNASLMAADYPTNRRDCMGIQAHLLMYFPQVLGWHYPGHQDHWHMDFNTSMKFTPESNAKTFFLQAALKYVFGVETLGTTGVEKDGVDGIFGGATKAALAKVMGSRIVGLAGSSLTKPTIWMDFLDTVRDEAFKLRVTT